MASGKKNNYENLTKPLNSPLFLSEDFDYTKLTKLQFIEILTYIKGKSNKIEIKGSLTNFRVAELKKMYEEKVEENKSFWIDFFQQNSNINNNKDSNIVINKDNIIKDINNKEEKKEKDDIVNKDIKEDNNINIKKEENIKNNNISSSSEEEGNMSDIIVDPKKIEAYILEHTKDRKLPLRNSQRKVLEAQAEKEIKQKIIKHNININNNNISKKQKVTKRNNNNITKKNINNITKKNNEKDNNNISEKDNNNINENINVLSLERLSDSNSNFFMLSNTTNPFKDRPKQLEKKFYHLNLFFISVIVLSIIIGFNLGDSNNSFWSFQHYWMYLSFLITFLLLLLSVRCDNIYTNLILKKLCLFPLNFVYLDEFRQYYKKSYFNFVDEVVFWYFCKVYIFVIIGDNKNRKYKVNFFITDNNINANNNNNNKRIICVYEDNNTDNNIISSSVSN